jgi:hypothetical protein
MTKMNEPWRDLLGPEISRDLDDLAAAHYGADPVTMLRHAVMNFIFKECEQNAGTKDRYRLQQSIRRE